MSNAPVCMPTFRLLCTLLLLQLPAGAWAQQVNAQLNFLADSMAVGEVVALQLRIQHPGEVRILFPQGEREFAPFERVAVEFTEPERSRQRIWSEVTYQLRSFDLAPKQGVRLSYVYQRGADTLRAWVESDSIRLVSRLPEETQGLGYRSHEGLLTVSDPPDYRWLFFFLGGLLLLGGLMMVLLRRPIRRFIRRRQLSQEWYQVRKQLRKLGQERDQENFFEQLGYLWKSYLSEAECVPLLSMTTTELRDTILQMPHLSMEQQHALLQIAEEGDQVIYAGNELPPQQMERHLRTARQILTLEYRRRKRKLEEKKGKA